MDKRIKRYIIGIAIIFGIFVLIGLYLGSLNVGFRTTTLLYGGNSMIAYTETCGTALDKYGAASGLGYIQVGDCSQAKGSYGQTTTSYILDIPGRMTEHGIDDGRTKIKTSLLQDDSNPDLLYVCSDIQEGGYLYMTYFKNHQIAGLDIDTSSHPINPLMEVNCQ